MLTYRQAQNPAITGVPSVVSSDLPADPVNSQPRKGVDEPEEFTPTPAFSITESSTTTLPTALANTTPTALADNSGDGNKHGDGEGRHRDRPGNGDNNKNGGMSQTAEHLLISAGSIGEPRWSDYDSRVTNSIYRIVYSSVFHSMDYLANNEEIQEEKWR